MGVHAADGDQAGKVLKDIFQKKEKRKKDSYPRRNHFSVVSQTKNRVRTIKTGSSMLILMGFSVGMTWGQSLALFIVVFKAATSRAWDYLLSCPRFVLFLWPQ